MPANLTSLPLPQKIGQLFFIGIPGPDLDEATRRLLDEIKPGGVCLFARNMRDAEQTRALIADLKAALPTEPFISIDQEGGLVDRLRRIVGPMPAANKIRSKAEARRLALIIAASLRTLGFNMNFAPVVDVIDAKRAEASNGLYSRGFGDSAAETAEMAGEFLREMQDEGIIGCLKHFPGLGASRVDSHEELPIIDVDDAELATVDLLPYRSILASGSARMVMTAHALFPLSRMQERDENGKLLPASLSKNFVSQLLRRDMGFEGVSITDDLEMGAIEKNYGIADACVRAIEAGQDMLAICAKPENIRAGFNAVTLAIETEQIAESRVDESLARIASLKAQISPTTKFDLRRITDISVEIREFINDLNR
ncbi:MAG: beta-N-acetylhexosaminidase [Blastocatellia bacterium]|nr:beta-N-acetylhexosaminidase [Blastocatellia bacterium]